MNGKTKLGILVILCIMCLFSMVFGFTAFADGEASTEAAMLTNARVSTNENLLDRTGTIMGNDYRSGYNTAGSYNSGVITVTHPENTDARVGFLLNNTALDKTIVLKGSEVVQTSSLSVYYSAELTFGSYENTYSTYGLTVAKTVNGDNTTYHTYTFEQGRGYVHYYKYDTNPANETDGVPYDKATYDAVKTNETVVKFEIIKVADIFYLYINGNYCFSHTIENASPVFGTMMFDTDVTYRNIVFKYLDENVDVDSEAVIPTKLASARTFEGTYATGKADVTSMSDNLRSSNTLVEYKNSSIVSTITCDDSWTSSANALTDGYLDASVKKDGEEVATSALGTLITASVNFTKSQYNYKKIGVLFGKKAEDDNTRYYSVVYEPQRGFVFIYTFLRTSAGGVSSENELPIYTSSNFNLAEGKNHTFDIIVENSGINVYINNKVIVENYASVTDNGTTVQLTGVTPVVGAMFREMQGTVSNMSLKYLASVEFVLPLPTNLENARNNGTNITSNLTLVSTSNLRDSGRNMISFSNNEGTATKEKDGRDVRMFNNKELRQSQAYVGTDDSKTLVDTSTLSVYYSANLTYKDIDNEYGYFGLLIGKNTVDNNTRYYSLTIEPNRGFVFIYYFDINTNDAVVSEGNINVVTNKNIGVDKNVEKRLEIIRSGDTLSVYYNNKTVIENFTDDGFKNVTPIFGLKTFGVSGTYKNLEMKVLTENYEFYLPDTRPQWTTNNVITNITDVNCVKENGETTITAIDGKLVYPNDAEYDSYIEDIKDYVYIVEDDIFKRINDSTLESYVQAKLKFGEFGADKQSWYGAGITFRGTYAKGYAIRFLGSNALLMKDGAEIANVGIVSAIETNTELTVQIYSTPTMFNLWVNGEQIFEDYKVDLANYKCSLGIHAVYNAVEVSNVSMQYSVNIYDKNPNASSVNTLKSIKLDNELLEGFDASKTEYSFTLNRGDDAPVVSQFKAETTHEYASAKIDANGDDIVITITAENGDVKVYTIHYIAQRNSDSTLKSLKIGDSEIKLAAGTTEYSFTMPAHKSYPEVKDIVAEKNDEYANTPVVTIGGDKVKISVTAEDGSKTEYVVHIALNLSSNATLSSITVKGKAIEIKADTFEYSISMAETVSEEDIEFACADGYANAQVEIEDKKATITVTAENGATKTYIVNFTEGKVKKGCSGTADFGSLIFVFASILAVVLLKKKEI